MSLSRALALAVLLTLAGASIGAWGWLRLPGWIMVQVGPALLPKLPGLAVLPSIAAAATAAAGVGLRPRGSPPATPAGIAGLGLLGLTALLLVGEGALVARALNPEFDVVRWSFIAAAAVLLLVGGALRRRPRSAAPGRLMIFAAAALAGAAIFLPDLPLLIALLLVAVGGPAILETRRARDRPEPAVSSDSRR